MVKGAYTFGPFDHLSDILYLPPQIVSKPAAAC